MNNSRELKIAIINKLKNAKGVLFRHVDGSEYATTCPFCAHTSNSPFKLRFYLKIDINNDGPIEYKCFRCDKKGKQMKSDVLSKLLGTQDELMLKALDNTKFTGTLIDKMNNYHEQKINMNIRYSYKLPKVKYGKKIKYIEDRLGFKLTQSLCEEFKIITSLREFLYINNTKIRDKDKKLCIFLENNCVGFLNTSASYILFRTINDNDDIRWFKYRINNYLPKGPMMYSISSPIDIFTNDTIYINITEGIMDILSIYKNLEYYKFSNTLNIAMSGKYYTNTINYVISKGLVGSNVVLNIFSDADHRYKKGVYDTTLEYYKKHLNKYTYLFKEVNVCYNLKKKDFGYSLNDIMNDKYKL